MEPILDLFNTILKIAFLGGVVLFVSKMIKSNRFKNVKHEIEVLQAKLSQYRLVLKSKVKKKSQIFRVSFKGPVSEGDLIDQTIKSLGENNFEKGDDFQNYFESSRKIVHFLQVDSNAANPLQTTPQTLENNFMCPDFKLEMDIVRVIKEMTDLNSRINTSIDEYNGKTRKVQLHLKKNESLNFPSLSEINKIFDSDKAEEKTTASGDVKKAS